MNTSTHDSEGSLGQNERTSALFASMIVQHTNMAMIFLGQAPNPQTGKTGQDLEHARYFIDQLEMIEVKTKGNLNKQEDALLKQSLTHLRLAFVEAVEHPAKTAPAPEAATPANPPVDEQETPITEPASQGEGTVETESRKKFSKKY
jgi:hypothetical protein